MHSFVGKIQKGLSQIVPKRPSVAFSSYFNKNDLLEVESGDDVHAVREGYFSVLASKDGETKRFVVGLHYLTDPAFLGLLEQAREEYGFIQNKGAISVPCQPHELQKILDRIQGAGN